MMSREPSLRDKLSAKFLAAFEADFAENGVEVIQKLREKYPQHYAELGARLIASTEEPAGPTDFSDCQSQEDIGRKLLMQLGLGEYQITDRMCQQAVDANEKLITALERIAQDALQ
jgi:hypothetical protein